MCVIVKGKNGKPDIGVIRSEQEPGEGGSSTRFGNSYGRVFLVCLRDGEILQRVQESALAVCLNLDATKETSQRDYLQALAEIIGLPNDPTGEKWR